MREIKTLSEYFKYLPREVHRNWTPYKADRDYEVTVQFVVHRDGSISNVQIIGTNYPSANQSVLKAVKSGAPYQPLPLSFERDSVKAQIFLEYHKEQQTD
jgi:outer membrane biosynthesis protein TonB